MTTRQFNAQFHCPNCKTWQTQETMFGRWIRNNPELDSKKGYSVSDQDYCVHEYKTYDSREFQCIMWIEIKTMGAELSLAQKDTLYICNQLLRNRRQTPTKKLQWQAGESISECFSAVLGRTVRVKAFGVHVLTFSGLGPEDSEWIKWDKDFINTDTLTKLLRLDLDPDTLKPLDLRRHHRTHENQVMPLFDEKEESA